MGVRYALTQAFFMVLVPLVQLVAGLFMWLRPPRRINPIYGYRTALSMKNEDTWAFAHWHCGRLWTVVGLVQLVLSGVVAVWVLTQGRTSLMMLEMTLIFTQTLVLLVSIVPTEVVMRRTFDRKGRRLPPQGGGTAPH